MHLEYAMLANNAEMGAMNRVHIFGGDIERWTSYTFPVNVLLTFYAKFHVPQDEFNHVHRYRIELGLPNSADCQRLMENSEITTVAETVRPELGSKMRIFIHFHAQLQAPGDYTIRLLIDDVETVRLPLYAIELEAA